MDAENKKKFDGVINEFEQLVKEGRIKKVRAIDDPEDEAPATTATPLLHKVGQHHATPSPKVKYDNINDEFLQRVAEGKIKVAPAIDDESTVNMNSLEGLSGKVTVEHTLSAKTSVNFEANADQLPYAEVNADVTCVDGDCTQVE